MGDGFRVVAHLTGSLWPERSAILRSGCRSSGLTKRGKSGMPGTAIEALVIGLAVLLIVLIVIGAFGRL